MNRRLALIVTCRGRAGAVRFGLRRVEGQAAIVLNLGKVVRTDLAPACISSGR